MKKLGVLGSPISHSRSPEIHQAFADSCGISIDYQKILVPEGEFKKTALGFLSSGALGFNITLPNKYDALLLADELSVEAVSAGAVNTIYRQEKGRLIGYNTDGRGLVSDIVTNLGWTVANKKVLIVGAGGAVQGVVASLLEENPAQLDIYNRTSERAEKLALKVGDERFKAKTIKQLCEPYDLVISGSSAGLFGSEEGELPERVISSETCCYDMIYGKDQTPFLSWCFEVNCQDLSDGLGMLVEQAALAFTIWFGHTVSTRPVIEQLRDTL